MNLKFKNVYEDNENITQIEQLYEESFPEYERFDFNFLQKASKRKDNKFWVIYDDNNLIGLTYLTFDKNMIFILYLTVDSQYRNKGYGSEILNLLKEKYKNYHFILDIEEVKKDSKNYHQRVIRKKFYEKNDFISTNLGMSYQGEEYEYLCTSNMNINDKIITKLFGKLYNPVIQFFTKFYRFDLYQIR